MVELLSSWRVKRDNIIIINIIVVTFECQVVVLAGSGGGGFHSQSGKVFSV